MLEIPLAPLQYISDRHMMMMSSCMQQKYISTEVQCITSRETIAIGCFCRFKLFKTFKNFYGPSLLSEPKMERRVLSVPEVTPMPTLPDKALYEHLSQKERMLGGFPYSPFDPEIIEIRKRARLLQRQFNDAKDDDNETRREILRQLLNPACKDNNIYFEPDLRVDHGIYITIGDNFQANYNCVLLDCARIDIGDNCLFGPNVQLYAATHPLDAAYRQANEDYLETAYPIKIGDNCWLGGMSVVNPGITIGNNVVVGAGSVVTKDVPDNCVVAGNPAKVIRHMPPRQTVTPKKNRPE